jgi:hypothetical protein
MKIVTDILRDIYAIPAIYMRYRDMYATTSRELFESIIAYTSRISCAIPCDIYTILIYYDFHHYSCDIHAMRMRCYLYAISHAICMRSTSHEYRTRDIYTMPHRICIAHDMYALYIVYTSHVNCLRYKYDIYAIPCVEIQAIFRRYAGDICAIPDCGDPHNVAYISHATCMRYISHG